jgi:hypothetical protein
MQAILSIGIHGGQNECVDGPVIKHHVVAGIDTLLFSILSGRDNLDVGKQTDRGRNVCLFAGMGRFDGSVIDGDLRLG